MGRRSRNRELDIALGVAQLIALLVVAAIFLPTFRQMHLSLGVILIGAVVLVGVIAFGVFLIRRTKQKSTFDSTHFTTLEATVARFDPETIAILLDKRKFCPKCESEMVLRTAAKGLNAGTQFWGCSDYPKCRFTMQA